MFLTVKKLVTIFISIILLITASACKDSPEKVSKELKKPDMKLLAGKWLRTDSDYTISISQVNDDGSLNAQYFNPDPINVGRANWQAINGSLKIIIELRDVNYPGSTYTLNYLPERDILAGDYYQAFEGLNFYVEFSRIK